MPGVRELFEQEPPPPPRRTRAELMKEVDANYYGYMDDDDELLEPLEEKASKIALQKTVAEWKENKLKKGTTEEPTEEEDATLNADKESTTVGPRFTSHVVIPTQKDIEGAILKKKKKELMEKYGI